MVLAWTTLDQQEQRHEVVSGAACAADLGGALRFRSNSFPRDVSSIGHDYRHDNLVEFFQSAVQGLWRIRRTSNAAVCAGVEDVAAQAGRPVRYLASPAIDKERLVDQIVLEQGVGPGGVLAILSAVEVCQSFDIYRNREQKILELRPARRKCLHYYVYFQDAVFGRVQVRLQTWFPWNTHVVINGREWLARQLDAHGIRYDRARHLLPLDRGLPAGPAADGPAVAYRLGTESDAALGPGHLTRRELLAPWELNPYWSAEQSEWATDIAFRSCRDLGQLYPQLIHHAIRTFDSRDVMRFLGKSFARQPYINGHFKGEVVSDVAARPEGIRVKHRLKANSIKMYDKQGSVLRVETTINDAHDLKCYCAAEGDPNGRAATVHFARGWPISPAEPNSATLPTAVIWMRWRLPRRPALSRN